MVHYNKDLQLGKKTIKPILIKVEQLENYIAKCILTNENYKDKESFHLKAYLAFEQHIVSK